MSESDLKKSPAAFLARLSGRFSGGASFDEPRESASQNITQNNNHQLAQASHVDNTPAPSKPKRDIKELYDFIDNWCSTAD